MENDTNCWKCIGTGKVLGNGLYNYEPCPLCHSEEYKEWKRVGELNKEKTNSDKTNKGNTT